MNPSDLVQELAQRLNLTGVTFADGICRLVFDDALAIDLEDDGNGGLTLHTVLAPLPHEGREVVMAALLSAHLFGLDTDGAVFGLHPQTQDLYLFRTLAAATLDVDAAYAALEQFTHQAEAWKTRIDVLVRDAEPAAASVPDSGLGFVRA
jgi:hypothetical protein